ncbi:MAG TPA: prephenate dehydratase [bacterium]|nr:prephenate dehydratase [bacterium]
MEKDIKAQRKKIDIVDSGIVSLLHRRAASVRKIAGLKKRGASEAYDPAREAMILKKLKRPKKGGFPPSGIEAVYNEIFSVSRGLQAPVRIAYLGPKASYSNLAAVKRFGKASSYIPVMSIKDVFLEVEKGNADYGCVPIENSTEGAVNYTYDLFADHELKIYSEVLLAIKHNLLSKEKALKAVKLLYVHPQTLAQCRGWIEDNLGRAAIKEVSSNSRAAELAAKTKGAAGIAGELAAEVYGLKILAKSIEDMAENITRFFILGKGISPKSQDDKTSIMVSIKDRVGALYSLLKPFERHNINLTNIESRPSRKKAWDYYFFVDFLGHVSSDRVVRALKEVEKECGDVRVLGSYPRF